MRPHLPLPRARARGALPWPRIGAVLAVLATVALLAAGIAFRSFEYDETYTHILVSGGSLRPDWPLEHRPVEEFRARYAETGTAAEVLGNLLRWDIHPPLYFWVQIGWRQLFGPDHLALRAFSALTLLGALALTWQLARVARVAPLPAIACTGLAYTFLYSGTFARAYGLALLLVMAGAVLLAALLRRAERGELAGAAPRAAGAAFLLALAVLCHYLALLPVLGLAGAAGLAWMAATWWRGGLLRLAVPAAIAAGALPPLLAMAWLRAQQGSATWFLAGFEWATAFVKLGMGQTAALFGGLPMYVAPPWNAVVTVPVVSAAAVLGVLAMLGAWAGRRDPVRFLVLAGALVMPVGLLAVGVITDRSPFEFRYFLFGIPFLAIAFAGGLAVVDQARPRLAVALAVWVLGWQAAGSIPMPFAQTTQQEYRALVAEMTPHWRPGAVLAVPQGYDGVGMNGPFVWEAPGEWLMKVLRRDETPEDQARAFAGVPRVLLFTLADDQGREALAVFRAAQAREPGAWRLVAESRGMEVWDHAPR